MFRRVSWPALSIGLALLACVISGCKEPVIVSAPPKPKETVVAQKPESTQLIDPVRVQEQMMLRLCDAYNQAERAMHETVATESAKSRAFIVDRKHRAKAFSDAMLSMSGQWAYLQSQLGVGGRKQEWMRYTRSWNGEIKASQYSDPLEDHLKEQFEACILKPSEIQEEVERLVKRLEARFKVIENELLVRVQKDMEDLKVLELPQFKHLTDIHAFRAIYAQQLQRSMEQASLTIPADMARSFVASDIGFFIGVRLSTTLATRLGITGVASGLGVAGNVLTGGATLAVGFAGASLFDDLVKHLLKNWFNYDPEGDIAGQVEITLNTLGNQLFGSLECAREVYLLHIYRDYLRAEEGYPFQAVRERLDDTIKKMELNSYLGLEWHLVQYMHNWSLSRQAGLLQALSGNEQSTEPMRFARWAPGKQPTLEEVTQYCEATLQKWGAKKCN